jgi:predicted amino acid dehydrogenase
VAESCSVSVTTGNSLTVYSSIIALDKISQRLAIDLSQHNIIVIGFPGSIALALTKILLKRGLNLTLVSHRKTAYIDRFLKEMGADASRVAITQNLTEALGKGKIIFSATSTGNIIDPDALPAGSIVFDIAQPRDVIYKRNGRNDILVIDAGMISLPRSTQRKYRYSGLETNDIPSCLGETITLTFESRWENFSMGRELYIDKIEEIGRLGEKHGFVFDAFRSFQKPIPDIRFNMTGEALHRT